jgi:UDP-N-acetylmuramoylalanine--D-glutamate ligase
MPTAYVIGLGKSGNAAARLLNAQGWQVTVSDSGDSPALQHQRQELLADGIQVCLGQPFDPVADQPELVVVSPGVPWDIPALVQARSLGIVTIGDMELAWRQLRNQRWVAITGTNGKTTVTALTAAMFQAAGYQAPAFGNIGYAACEVAQGQTLPDWCIAEVSSYQIEAAPSLTPQVAIWTTFTPDHLARHKTMANYFEMKARLLSRAGVQVWNGDDPYLRELGQRQDYPVRSDACWTSIQGKAYLVGDPARGAYLEAGWVVVQGEKIAPIDTLQMPGAHNRQNLLMAAAAAYVAGVDKGAIAQAMATFPGVPHRLEPIRTWQGIEWINDSKATNYDAADVGLSSVAAPAILIAGGDPKTGDDTAWLQTIKTQAAAVLLIGAAASAFAQRLSEVGYEQYECVDTMERAVTRAAELAQQRAAVVVLLSPACASFDQYANFEERGDHFRQLCQALPD